MLQFDCSKERKLPLSCEERLQQHWMLYRQMNWLGGGGGGVVPDNSNPNQKIGVNECQIVNFSVPT